MRLFDPSRYGDECQQLIDGAALCELGPGEANVAVYDRLRELTPETLANGRRIADREMANCCISGLWLLHNYLDDSHTISQSVDTTTGSYWHGIMHRRETDFSNSKYWFRRVGDHPVFEPLANTAGAIAAEESGVDELAGLTSADGWDPYRFVDLCESALRQHGGLGTACRKIAQAEWRLLFDHCFDAAFP